MAISESVIFYYMGVSLMVQYIQYKIIVAKIDCPMGSIWLCTRKLQSKKLLKQILLQILSSDFLLIIWVLHVP